MAENPVPGAQRGLQELDCMGDVAVTTGLLRDPTSFGCTSNDVRVADTDVLSVDDVETGPFTCTEGEDITVQIAVDFINGANSRRSDIGLWLAQNGTDAETGNCEHFYFPVADGFLGNADAPVNDTCGDLDGQETKLNVTLDPFILTCGGDPDSSTQQVAIGSCIGWKVPGADENCDLVAGDPPNANYAAATLPANKAKCRCETLTLNITILRPPTIAKTCLSATLDDVAETVAFDFTVNITNPNPDAITPWTVTDTPVEFQPQLNSDNNGSLAQGSTIFNPTITLPVTEALDQNPFNDTVTLETDDYPDVSDSAECPEWTLPPPALVATIDCDDQGTTADGTNFIVTQAFNGTVCNTGLSKAKNVTVTVKDGNNNVIFSAGPQDLLASDPDACIVFTTVPGSVTASFTGTCDATFTATVMAEGKDIVGGDLFDMDSANCPVCDCQ